MTNVKTVFGTVIYQEAWKFMGEFIESLNRQTADFDLLIINDNCTPAQIQELSDQCRHRIILSQPSDKMSPAELRIELVCRALDMEYDLMILGDFDDIIMENRVERIKSCYSCEYAFFYNELYDFNHKNVMKNIPEFTLGIEDILNYNYLGLSNTALNLNHLTKELMLSMRQDGTAIFDWYFFSRILLNDKKGRLVKDTGTFYRIHDHNIAGITGKDITGEKIKKEIEVKIQHYSLLLKYHPIFAGKLDFYQNLKIRTGQLHSCACSTGSEEFWWGLTRDCNPN